MPLSSEQYIIYYVIIMLLLDYVDDLLEEVINIV